MGQQGGQRRVSLALSCMAAVAVLASGGCAKLGLGGGGGDISLPKPDHGVQMMVGPIEVPQGTEVQQNWYVKAPNDKPLDVHKFEILMTPGSHHFNIFRSTTEDIPDGKVENSFDALHWEAWDLIVDSQVQHFVWELPPGVAFRLEPHQQMNLQIHYVNATTQKTPGAGKAILNLTEAEPGTVKEYVGGLFAQNRKITLPPHAESTFDKTCTFPQDVKLAMFTGHFHSHGKAFVAYKANLDGSRGAEIYRSENWDEPPMKVFTDPIAFQKGEGIQYVTSYVNNTDRIIGFGPHVETDEHANAFAYYYPALPGSKSIYCF
jgi:hypothetical protein